MVADAVAVVEGVYRSEWAGLWPRSSGGHPTKNGHDFAFHPEPRSHDGIDLAKGYQHGVN
jgi:hypothetical protein